MTVPPTDAYRNKVVNLYSDLLLHNMGAGLADDIVQGQAQGDEFRSAPLWGLGQRLSVEGPSAGIIFPARIAEKSPLWPTVPAVACCMIFMTGCVAGRIQT